MGLLKIALLQDSPGSGVSPSYMSVLEKQRPDILALPEYYFVDPTDDSVISSSSRKDEIVNELTNLSLKLDCILVGGSLVERVEGCFYNRCCLFDSGQVVGHYDKVHPFDNEGRGLIKEGVEYKVFDVRGIRIGVLICSDALYPGSFENIRGLQPDLVFIPTTSPYRPGERNMTKFARDRRVYAAGAARTDCLIFKVCASGAIIRHGLQGRSLIAAPGRIVWRVEPAFEHRSALVMARMQAISSHADLDISVYQS